MPWYSLLRRAHPLHMLPLHYYSPTLHPLGPVTGRRRDEPRDSPPAAAKAPGWVLLNMYGIRTDASFVADARTVAYARTSKGHHLRVSLGRAPPPASSFVYYDFPDTAPGVEEEDDDVDERDKDDGVDDDDECDEDDDDDECEVDRGLQRRRLAHQCRRGPWGLGPLEDEQPALPVRFRGRALPVQGRRRRRLAVYVAAPRPRLSSPSPSKSANPTCRPRSAPSCTAGPRPCSGEATATSCWSSSTASTTATRDGTRPSSVCSAAARPGGSSRSRCPSSFTTTVAAKAASSSSGGAAPTPSSLSATGSFAGSSTRAASSCATWRTMRSPRSATHLCRPA
jgi:hypothetical protein